MELIGLRYFNVFGQCQEPNGAYAAVIPKFVLQFMAHESPVINGDETYSRDFTYVNNAAQVNQLAVITETPAAINQVYNVACGGRVDLKEMTSVLKEELAQFDPAIGNVGVVNCSERLGDIPPPADISKTRPLLGYEPSHHFTAGMNKAAQWYYENFNNT